MMVGFDDDDRRFRRKDTWVKLECVNCHKSPETVKVMLPLWNNGQQNIPLCIDCSTRCSPTDNTLRETHLEHVRKRSEAYNIMSSAS